MTKPLKKAKKEAPKKIGRPSDYNLKMAVRVCEEIATCTDSYDSICERNPDFPSHKTMRFWRYKHEEFRTMYTIARQFQADLYIDEIRERARDRHLDLIDTDQGTRPNPTAVARDKLIIETDKWIACKVLPKVYGANVESDIGGQGVLKELADTITKLVKANEREY